MSSPTIGRVCPVCGATFEVPVRRDRLIIPDSPDSGQILIADHPLAPHEPNADLCPRCRKEFGDFARVICLKCHKIVTRVQPGMTPDGFVVAPGAILHVRECPTCQPNVQFSTFVEAEAFERLKGKNG